jgi:DNA-binding transcriptional ArsR family regulator
VGHRFNLRGDWGGVLDCEVLAIEPNKTLSYTWDFKHDHAAYNLKSVVILRSRQRAQARAFAWSRRASGPIRSRLSAAPRPGPSSWLAIVSRLSADGLLPTSRLKQGTRVSRQTVTKHLGVLEDAGLVRSDRVGRDRLWQIEARQLAELRPYLDQISARWDQTLERLRSYVEADRNE